jgi:hypothetical protein
VISVLFLGACFNADAQEGKVFDLAEIIRGRIKQIVQIKQEKGKHEKAKIEISNFRDFKAEKVDPSEPIAAKSIRYFDDKYVKSGIANKDTVGLILVDSFSATADLVGQQYLYSDTVTVYCKNRYDHNWRTSSPIDSLRIYNAKDSLVFKQVYRYNRSRYLVAVNNSYGYGTIADKILFAYLEFDRQGNWIKRIEKMVKNDKVIHIDIVTRKITYY